jgi:diguanylate cyclase (GGDEF)-like protein/PAS domain S-box-containing protein
MNNFDNKLVKVLLVDDDEEDYVLTRYLFDDFKDNRYKLEWVNSYTEGLSAMQSNLYDIYLVDFRLGSESGLGLIRSAIKSGCFAPMILLTGQNDKEIDLEAMQAGAADYLVKGEIEAPLLERSIRYSLQHARSLEKIQTSEAKFRSVIQSACDAIFLVDQEGIIVLWNKAAAEIFGYSEDEIIGKSTHLLMGKKYAQKAIEMGIQKTIETVLVPMTGTIIQASGRNKAGKEFPLELSGSVWKSSEGSYYTAIIRDITERRAAEERLLHEATHDSLTGLPNRAQFTSILQDAIEYKKKREEYQFAVLFLDLDRFKVINDGLGHVVGDKLLVGIADRLRLGVRPGDAVSRFGGDEFTILLHNIKDTASAIEIAERLQNELGKPFIIDGYEVFTTASIGITISDASHKKPEDFLRDADAAMYQAKATGKAHYEIFDKALHLRNFSLLHRENDLRYAIERGEFKVYYQPILNLQTLEICEFEALLRWDHSELGLVPPNDFIPVAEETGLIIPIGKWVLEESCRQLVEWQNKFPAQKQIGISVNLSVKQLMCQDLIEQVKDVMANTNINPKLLKLEVTESGVMENADMALKILSELCDLGIRISSDDFGTGYSSLSYLHNFPFEHLKIDRSFVAKMDNDTKSEEIIKTILLLGKNLDLEIVAEGIETETQLRQLRELGCNFGQGYLFSKPVDAKAAQLLLSEGIQNIFNQYALPPQVNFDKIESIKIAEIQ